MAKTKSKVKFDLKGFLLKKGEYLAMGIAGFFLFLLMVWGITKWTGAEDPSQDQQGNDPEGLSDPVRHRQLGGH